MGAGFGRHHALDRRRLKLRQSFALELVSGDHHEAGIWRAISVYLGTRTHVVHGWTGNMRWTLLEDRQPVRRAGSTASFFLFDGHEIVALKLEQRDENGHFTKEGRFHVNIYSNTPGAPVKVYLYLEQIGADIIKAIEYQRQLSRQIGKMQGAMRIMRESKFPTWEAGLSQDQREDELTILLRQKYGDEHRKIMAAGSEVVLESILTVAKIHGVRFLSITNLDLIVFEDIDVSVGRVIADLLDIEHVRPMHIEHSVSIFLGDFLKPEHFGIYDLREETFERIPMVITRENMKWWTIHDQYDESVSLYEWFSKCLR